MEVLINKSGKAQGIVDVQRELFHVWLYVSGLNRRESCNLPISPNFLVEFEWSKVYRLAASLKMSSLAAIETPHFLQSRFA
jgi:hypothetical protein